MSSATDQAVVAVLAMLGSLLGLAALWVIGRALTYRPPAARRKPRAEDFYGDRDSDAY